MQLNVYFCTQKRNILKYYGIFILIVLLLSCQSRKENTLTTPWGEEVELYNNTDNTEEHGNRGQDSFDLEQIEQASELIALTIAGPDTYFDYHGSFLGVHSILCQQFADSLGVKLRIELCRDTTELYKRLSNGDADLIAYPVEKEAFNGLGWYVANEKPRLKQALDQWYSLSKLASAKEEENKLLHSGGGVKRKFYAQMLNQKNGIISLYDALFQKHCKKIHWDWRLMAAQCYQESTFDPNAVSWAGAKGLMQIMPHTADHLGLSHHQMFDPEHNIAAAARYIKELDNTFSDIPSRVERQNFILAAYNGGAHHVRDAMALARREGKNPYRWSDVASFVLKLSEPDYYQDPIVKYGYMRGNETYNYVELIKKRYAKYRGVKSSVPLSIAPQKSQNARHRSKFKI